jgi:TPP-dependent pyruvate/acetoin dehydrogenase alpha subunit
MTLKNEDLLSIYRYMVLCRALEQAISKTAGNWHPAEGEEGVVIGTFYHLRPDDVVAPHYRGIPVIQYMRGAPLRRIWGGLMGKVSSYSRGRFRALRGPFELNILGTFSGVLGPTISIAVGAGLAAKLDKSDRVAVTSFGDGTSNRGDFHEAVNMAAIYKLPVVFVCQNNQFAISTPASKGLGCRSVADRAAGYGIPGVEVDGNDVLAMHEVVQEAVRRARQGEGPTLIEGRTYRMTGHLVSDPCLYRSNEEVEEWRKRDPINRLQQKLITLDLLKEGKIEEIRKGAEEEVAAAKKEAEADPLPGEEVLGVGDVFAPGREGRGDR